jgi:hypothetical protein
VAILVVTIISKFKTYRVTETQNFTELVAKIPTLKDVIVLEKLGEGAFGDVYRGLINVCRTVV